MSLTSSQRSTQDGVTTGCTTKSWTVCWTVQLCSTVCCTTTACATGCTTVCTGQAGCGEHGLCPNAISPTPAKAVTTKLVMAFLICLFITSSMFRVQVNY